MGIGAWDPWMQKRLLQNNGFAILHIVPEKVVH